jgi:hypothetical protein
VGSVDVKAGGTAPRFLREAEGGSPTRTIYAAFAIEIMGTTDAVLIVISLTSLPCLAFDEGGAMLKVLPVSLLL